MDNKTKIKNLKHNIVEYILAFVLLIYPLRKITTGIDLMDAGYSLGNYHFSDIMDEMWKIATYLANIVGEICSKLPYGDTWIGMNFYTSLFIGLTAAGCYAFMVKSYGYDNKWYKYLFFIAELSALSLCWAPSVILYHYLGYIMMTAASIILYKAVKNDSKKGYIISGIILGLCVAVRMPNVTYMAFILPLWYFCFIKKQDNWFKTLLNRTFICITGYLVGLLFPIAIICIKYGIDAYPQMIASLFGMTDTATDYKPTAMITGMLGDYINYSVWLMLFVAYMIIGVIAFKTIIYQKHKKVIERIFKAGYIAGLFVLLRVCYGRGMFNFDYSGYFSIYKWATVYLLIVILLCIGILFYKGNEQAENINDLKLWAVFLLVIIFITPLGGNNELYPIINNLFLVAPVSVYMFAEVLKILQSRLKSIFIYKATIIFMLFCITIQSIGFGMGFVFHDTLSDNESRVALKFKTVTVANGLKTTIAKKTELESLEKYLYENNLMNNSLILYGDIPALSYIFDMKPAIYTTWADLDSKDMERLQADLDKITDNYPVIIFGTKSVENIDKNSFCYEKLTAIRSFMDKNKYKQVYTSDTYQVYCCNAE